MRKDLISCKKADFAPGNKCALVCTVDGWPCAHQKYCGIVGHAINTGMADECKEYEVKGEAYELQA